jgi:hypothetical protein
MAQRKIQKPDLPDRRLEERSLPDANQKFADWLIKQTDMELDRLIESVDTLLEFEQRLVADEVWKLAGKQKVEDFKQFCVNQFGMNPDVVFPLLRELKAKIPYDLFGD